MKIWLSNEEPDIIDENIIWVKNSWDALKVINDYNSGINGGLDLIAKKYNIPRQSLYKWIIKDRKQGNQEKLPYKRVRRTKEKD